MSKYLVIGKSGTLGTEFQRLLGENATYAGHHDLDITDEAAVAEYISKANPEVIINCAAYNAVDKAEEEKDVATAINGTAVGNIAKAASSVGATLVHYGTNYVFKGDNTEGYSEDSTTDPQSTYGSTKLLGEQQALEHNPKTYVIRTAWLYGKKGESENSKMSFVDMMLKLASEKDELQSVSDQYGQPTWTKDLAEFTLHLIDSKAPFGLYHGTNSGETTWYGWLKEILAIKQIDIPVKQVSASTFATPTSAPRPQHGVLLCTKVTPMRPWQEALKDYLNSED